LEVFQFNVQDNEGMDLAAECSDGDGVLVPLKVTL